MEIGSAPYLASLRMDQAKGWDELGYHFVIGNGTDTRDGQVEVGSRRDLYMRLWRHERTVERGV